MLKLDRLTAIVTAAVTCTMMATIAVPAVIGSGLAAAAPSGKHPVSWDFRSAIPGMLDQTLDANWAPPGANDPTCKLTKERPNPVVLLNATATTQWAYTAGAPYLANRGYCVYTFNYGNITPVPSFPFQGLADIEASAREVSRKIDGIMRRTGAKKVDLVGWSQGGGLLPHYYIDFLGGDKKVDKLIGIAPGNHGSTGNMLTYLRYFIPPFGPVGYDIFKALFPAFAQQTQYSDLVRKVYGNGDTRPGPHYTTIVTKYDEIATPFTNGFLEGDNVTNILLQEDCPVDLSEHLAIAYSERAWRHVKNALTPAEATRVPCFQVDPVYPGMSEGR
ncbi:alpha/beta fold hydrolase [Gordonia sp. zg691]|uniref:Alpha/beta fold hydrolase n=1 Tax=Gordonia jinghuaiqii TaxID=2758710 RepID=A0A7D7LWC9_9ACTN|nr:alpha/beta fold hydrolase [Gordonia jinghuaiqii]MBD0860655.1 alpha/beta fold hydrolase [Gordonia jinghuaiqii]MCR5978079.1 triacylglycerol lipase [Gordonia jinghuaiqii]QMT01459.1 alpha/beta fold hydrolase [Gordonia jinghuaiqii]